MTFESWWRKNYSYAAVINPGAKDVAKAAFEAGLQTGRQEVKDSVNAALMQWCDKHQSYLDEDGLPISEELGRPVG